MVLLKRARGLTEALSVKNLKEYYTVKQTQDPCRQSGISAPAIYLFKEANIY